MVNFSQCSVYSAVVKESLAVSTENCESNTVTVLSLCVCVRVCVCESVSVSVCICAREMNVLAATYRMCIHTHTDLECL